jgi:hypothetical protein
MNIEEMSGFGDFVFGPKIMFCFISSAELLEIFLLLLSQAPIYTPLKFSTRSLNPVGVFSTIGIGVGVGVTLGVADGVGVAVGVAIGFGASVTPLFQTNFLPLLMHVYFLPSDVEVAPSFVQLPPAFTAAIALN